ncbi:hypothetical protein BU25DRAFT_416011 [Macroventuria anomochaeta]|uniref:Uncharacterized protein n=1 Tax=Macroventuria anomochaeta TaxID=301207 RepID=A0ACB6RIH6_9PLEO|nr:uncharacterized protein BU25DRAFT_416011 [Macroventuria anomochaeta]KAF2621633.1 hypothetical protein BU25DRAFT_416011 [Macroventuria anomochaeta]
MLSLNLTKRALQPIPLCLVLLAALRDSDGILEGRVVALESESLERRVSGKEVEDRAENGLLLGREGDAGGGGNVRVFDVEEGEEGLGGNFCYGFSLEFSAGGAQIGNREGTFGLML